MTDKLQRYHFGRFDGDGGLEKTDHADLGEWIKHDEAEAYFKREAQNECNGSCDIALARRQVGPDGHVPGNARECAEMWEAEANRLNREFRRPPTRFRLVRIWPKDEQPNIIECATLSDVHHALKSWFPDAWVAAVLTSTVMEFYDRDGGRTLATMTEVYE